MGSGKVIVVTGISGGGSSYFCSGYSKGDEKKVKVYSTADMVHALAQPNHSFPPNLKENLLYSHPDVLKGLMDRALQMIVNNLNSDRENYDTIFIDTHAQYLWDDVYTNTWSWRHLKQVNADMFITIIDKPSSIKERQLRTRLGRAQSHDLRDLLLWQNVEVNVTSGWADNYEKPMYVFSRKQNPRDIDALLDNWFMIYSSFPMTDAESDATRKIVEFKKKLRELRKDIDGYETPVIDPADIDVDNGNGLNEREKNAINFHTVHRDLNWDIAEATHVVAYYPDANMDLSKGVSDECTRAMGLGKYVYVICPRERQSPFMGIAHKVFKDENEFFNFFKPHMGEMLEYYKRDNCIKRAKRLTNILRRV